MCSSSSTSSKDAESDAPGGADREEPLEVARDQVGGEQRLAGPHPVAVAHDGVDLAVVGDEPERVGQRPAREGVGREPRVHDRERGGDPLVDQVGEEVVELVGGEHALVGEGARRQRREVDVGLVLGALAQAEREPLQRHAGDAGAGAGDEELAERRHHAAARWRRGRRGRSGRRASRGPRGPPRRRSPRSGGGSWRPARRRRAGTRADGVRAVRRAARSRTTSRRNASGTCIRMPAPSPELGSAPAAPRWSRLRRAVRAFGHDVVAGHAGQGRDEGDATGVVLVASVVEPLGRRERVRSGILPSSSAPASVRASTRLAAPACRHANVVRAGDDVGPSGGLTLPPGHAAEQWLPACRTPSRRRRLSGPAAPRQSRSSRRRSRRRWAT